MADVLLSDESEGTGKVNVFGSSFGIVFTTFFDDDEWADWANLTLRVEEAEQVAQALLDGIAAYRADPEDAENYNAWPLGRCTRRTPPESVVPAVEDAPPPAPF